MRNKVCPYFAKYYCNNSNKLGPFAKKILAPIQPCGQNKSLKRATSYVTEVDFKILPTQDRNLLSRVYLIRGFKRSILIPGDSPAPAEKIWLPQLLPILNGQPIEVLILGHHGSYTSTSEDLLQKLSPKVGIASARKRRYGHPHKIIEKRLRDYEASILSTEFWGTFIFQL